MKKIISILLSIVSIITFSTNVNAQAQSTITTNATSTTKYEYVDGLEIYYNNASGYPIFILDKNTTYGYSYSLAEPVEANEGFSYIITNMNVTNNSNKNYYIAQVAVLWYQDYLNGNDANIPASIKTKITNNTSDTTCYFIVKLVNGAKNYNEDKSSIRIIDKEVTFTKSGSYYYSNVIDVETDNLRNTPNISTKNAPSSTTIVNNTVTSNGEGAFQLRIPVNSLSNYKNDEFLIEITGSGYDNTVYKYTRFGTDAAIYGRVYSSNLNNEEDSIIAKINGISRTNVRFDITDEKGNYISGLKYEIYKGDCTNKTCYNTDLVESFTTNYTYKTLTNILDEGKYTLVLKSNYEYYNLPEKKLFNVVDTTDTQLIRVESNEKDNQKYNVTIYNITNKENRTIYIKDDFDKIYDSYKETSDKHISSLYPGAYVITASDNSLEVFFNLTEDGEILVHEGGNKINRNSINLDNYYIRYTQETPTPEEEIKNPVKEEEKEETTESSKENITYDENGNITIDNLDNVESIEIENKVNTKTEVKVEWLSDVIDCPITSLSSTIKYVIGTIILGAGAYLVVKNVKKSKNNA